MGEVLAKLFDDSAVEGLRTEAMACTEKDKEGEERGGGAEGMGGGKSRRYVHIDMRMATTSGGGMYCIISPAKHRGGGRTPPRCRSDNNRMVNEYSLHLVLSGWSSLFHTPITLARRLFAISKQRPKSSPSSAMSSKRENKIGLEANKSRINLSRSKGDRRGNMSLYCA